MAKKSSMFGLGALIAGVTGAVAGALGMFLSDKDNRDMVAKEVRHAEKVVAKDMKMVKSKAKKVIRSKSKKHAKRK